MLAVAPHLARRPGRGGRPGDAAEDQQQLGRCPPRATEGRAGEGVEVAAAADALIVDQDAAMAAVLSWEARTDAIAAGITGEPVAVLPIGNELHEDDRRPEFVSIRSTDF